MQTNLNSKLISEVSQMILENRRFSWPFRNRFEHTMRVLIWARRIWALEGGDLATIELAALFHDVGWEEGRPHAEVSAEIARQYLTNAGYFTDLVEPVVYAVGHHNARQIPREQLPLETRIVMDADILDELGTMSLVLDSMSVASEAEPSYRKVREKGRKYLAETKEKTGLLKTDTGLELYQDRVAWYERCLENFEYELGITESFGPPSTTALGCRAGMSLLRKELRGD